MRLDAVSHFPFYVRADLIKYIKTNYSHTIILEESLFDRAQDDRIAQLASAVESDAKLKSDFITSNLHYQHPDIFGQLASPKYMGDTIKLKLANLSISFTGNHDALRVLVPVAHQLADQLCSEENDPALTDKFMQLLYKRLAHRTIASLGGYFILRSDTELAFDTQRIFSNSHGLPLKTFALTPNHLEKLTPTNMSLLLTAISEYEVPNKDPHKKLFDNWSNILRNMPSLRKLTQPSKKSSEKTSVTATVEPEYNKQEIYDLFPYALTYLRNLKEMKLNHFCQSPRFPTKKFNTDTLREKIAWMQSITKINAITAKLETVDARTSYDTFMSLDNLIITVKCFLDDTTDMIFINSNPNTEIVITDLELEKVEVWFQAGKFPATDIEKMGVNLACPGDSATVTYYKGAYHNRCNGYPGFDLAFTRITGKTENQLPNVKN